MSDSDLTAEVPAAGDSDPTAEVLTAGDSDLTAEVQTADFLARPSGVVTFLFTDIEGSTRLWEEHPDHMGAALARHDSILRGVMEANGGFIFQTAGDSFRVAFFTAREALDAALAAARALQAES